MRKKALSLTVLLSLALLLALVAPATASADRVITPPDLGRVILIHYAAPEDAPGGPPPGKGPGGGGGGGDKVLDYYEPLGPRWGSTPVSYRVDPDFAPAGVVAQIEAAFEAWDDATSTELFALAVVDASAGPSLETPDEVNTVCFRLLAGLPNALAVTVIWYLDVDEIDGMSPGDLMYDTDVLFNLKFKWGIDSDGVGPSKLPKGYYDVCNIATHEAGHVAGLADLYDKVYSELTMYGYSSAGETKKITLELGDRLGAQALYGE